MPTERPESLAALYRALWHHAEGARGSIVLAFAMLLASQLFKLGVPWVAGQAIDAIQHGGLAGLAEAARWLLLVFAATVASWALHGPGRILERNVALRVKEKLVGRLMESLLAAPLAWHRRHHSGETTHRVQQSTHALYDFAQSQFIYLQNTVRLVGPVVALWLISPLVGMVAVAGYACLGGIIVIFDRRMMGLAMTENHAERRYTAALVDALGNVESLFALRRGRGVAALVMGRLRASFAPLRRGIVLNEAKWATVDLLSSLLWCVLVALYAWQASGPAAAGVAAGAVATVALGKVFMVYEYAQQAGGVITAIAAHFQSLARQRSDYAAGHPILQAPRAVPSLAPRASGWRQLGLAGVRHFHDGDEAEAAPALAGVDLTLERGLRYALVGPSGAGKTTLMRVLAGLETPAQGQVLLDGVAVAEGYARLRQEATLIPQQAEIFEGSLAENLLLGEEAGPERIHEALRAACAEGFVAAQPAGLAAPVAEGGANWSGGQRQRLALARGTLAAEGSALVLLDEPTASLDPETEARLYERIFQHFREACVVSSVHRLHLLERFDRVILMETGRVVGVGTVAELALGSPLFRALLDAQGAGA
ncbi:MAG: ABC transporter ATP-binding protein [Rhodocyclaceae bacterium]|jgi:ABC-type multidrug transport system fused ATPase/permease subunit|nr:ABC transporter ATP-binding protein [Rhodocyclaceae bacterium]